MIATMFLMQLAANVGSQGPDLVELSTIVEPYARCELAREPQVRALQDRWSVEAKRKYADPTDKPAAARAEALMGEMATLQKEIEAECGYEQTQQRLRARLQQLHPQMDSARAYWLARSAFNALNRLNETIVRMQAGVFPPSPAPPADIGDAR